MDILDMASDGADRSFFMGETWVSPKEVGAVVGVDGRTIRRWCEAGSIRCSRIPSGAWRISVDSEGWPLAAEE